jgi:ribonuclease HI
VHLHTDGASRGNPGPAALGAVITDARGRVLQELSEYLGTRTNNFAEYRALQRGLEAARALEADVVHCFLDSQLVVRQLTGQYRVKHAQIRPLFEEVQRLARTFRQVTYTHVMRADNAAADALANAALDRALARKG